MLFRYSFPMPQEGSVFPVVRYVRSDASPTLSMLIDMFEGLVERDREAVKFNPFDEHRKMIYSQNAACLFDLKNLLEDRMPKVCPSCPIAIVKCRTMRSSFDGKAGRIKVNLVEVIGKEDEPFLVEGSLMSGCL